MTPAQIYSHELIESEGGAVRSRNDLATTAHCSCNKALTEVRFSNVEQGSASHVITKTTR